MPTSILGDVSILQVPGVVTAIATVVNTMSEKLNTILYEPLLTAKVFKEVMTPIHDTLKDLAKSQREQASEMKKMERRIKKLEKKFDEEVPNLKVEVSNLSREFHRFSRGDLTFFEEVDEIGKECEHHEAIDNDDDDEEENPEDEDNLRLRRLAPIEDRQNTDGLARDVLVARDTPMIDVVEESIVEQTESQAREIVPQPATAEATPSQTEPAIIPPTFEGQTVTEPSITPPTTEVALTGNTLHSLLSFVLILSF